MLRHLSIIEGGQAGCSGLAADLRRQTRTLSSADLADEKLSCPLGKFLFSFDRIYWIFRIFYFLLSQFSDETAEKQSACA